MPAAQAIGTDIASTGLVSLSGSTVTPLKDFQALATAIAAVDANASDTGINMNSYAPSNAPRACPAVQQDVWLAAEALPPTPNATLCENMVKASACVPGDALAGNATKMASLFGTVCGLDAAACKGITANATTGTYGEFVMCNTTQQLTNALSTYYSNQKKASTACDFSGQAKVVTPSLSASQVGSPSSGNSSSVSSSSSPGNSTGTTSSGGSTTGNGSESGASSGGSTASAGTTSDGTAANGNSTQSSGSTSGGTSGAGRLTIVGSAGWAGSLLIAVGAVALTL